MVICLRLLIFPTMPSAIKARAKRPFLPRRAAAVRPSYFAASNVFAKLSLRVTIRLKTPGCRESGVK